MNPEQQKTLEKVKRHIDSYNTGYLEMDLGYKFRTKEFLNVIFLYINSVDVKNPDILGKNNKNTFVYEAQSQIRKVKEQIRLDLKDINFMLNGATSLSRFVIKAANRKIMEENNFASVIDEIPDNAVDFGSGFLKVWTSKGKLKMKSIDPYYMIFDQYNFSNGLKTEKFVRTYREVIEDESYDVQARASLKEFIEEKNLDDNYVLYQTIQDFPDGKQKVIITDPYTNGGYVFYEYETKSKDKLVKYYKYDLEKRKGFPDALGIGYNERIFNKLVQSKVNRERMDKMMTIASKLVFQKQIDNEIDNLVGKDAINIKDGVILGHKGNPITKMDTGGSEQAVLLGNEITKIINSIGNDLNVPEALQGNTLPSGTSGVLGNLLTENASSVLKEFKKGYANFLDFVYQDSINDYMLRGLNSDDSLQKYLTPNDYKLVRRSVKNYLVAQKYVDSVINNEPFDRAIAEAEVDKEIKNMKVIPGDMLEKIREEIDGVRTYISGENFSKPQAVAFIRELQTKYASNPEMLKDPFILSLIKKEAELDAGFSDLEIEQLLEEIPG